MNADDDDELSFPDAFAPIAHHLFPDGCPDETLADIWPLRTDRTLVPFLQAKAALLQVLRKWRGGLNGPQLDALVLVASHAVSGKCTSPLIRNFKDFLRCLIPKTRDCYLSPQSLQRLLLARLADDDRASLYRLFILAIRNRVLIQSIDQLSSRYYPLIFQHCQRLDEAIHLLHILTSRHHVCPFRAHRLSTWYYDKGKICIFLLLELYAKFDPKGCQKFLPKDDDERPPRLLRLKPDNKAWERELVKQISIIGDEQQPAKRLKRLAPLDGGTVMTVWRGQRDTSEVLTNEALLSHVALSDPFSDENVIQLRANLPYMLYEDWYVGDDDDDDVIIMEKDESDSDDDEETEMRQQRRPTVGASLHQTRIKVIKAFAVFSNHIGSLLPEIENFVLEDILPMWDGTDELGLTLCHDLLPHMTPSSDLHAKVLQYLEAFVRFGSPRLQYRILAGLVPQWIRQWGNKRETIRLIKWASAEMKRAFLGNGGHELLRLAILDLYDAVRVTTSLLPNSVVVYTLLLSRTTVSINQLCVLLMKYRGTLLKERALRGRRDAERRIALFNSYVWDICSICWRNSIARHVSSCLFKDVPEQVMAAVGKDHQSALSITHSAAFIGYYRTGASSRAKYVDNLRDRGLTGLHSFLLAFIGALADREQRKRNSKK